MILTEEEARTKWCPETTVFIAPESPQWPYAMLDSRGAPSTHPEFTRCIASGCPVWRWGSGENMAWKKPDGIIHWSYNGETYAEGEQGQAAAGWLRLGYCGKGGNP